MTTPADGVLRGGVLRGSPDPKPAPETTEQPIAGPNALPKMAYHEVKARAQRIYDQRGKPPYPPGSTVLSPDEAEVISEFVHYWLQLLRQG